MKDLYDSRKVSPYIDFELENISGSYDIVDSMHRISVSGVQEKFPAVIENGKIRIAKEGERSTHILKPAPWNEALSNRRLIPANEYLTMKIASQIYNIETAACGLCFTPKNRAIYITKRFDILPNGKKATMEDFASAIGKNEKTNGINFKYSGSYEDIATALKDKVAAWMPDMEMFFNMVVFNYIYANGDAHLKNFSLIRYAEDYRLAPAYDLMNTALHVDGADFGLDGGLSTNIMKSDIYEKTGHPCRQDFEHFAKRIGILENRAARILDRYTSLPNSAIDLIANSFLTEKAKRTYHRIINQRLSHLNRK